MDAWHCCTEITQTALTDLLCMQKDVDVWTDAGVPKSQLLSSLTALTAGKQSNSATGDEQFEALTKYGVDLTAAVAKLDPVIGRDDEIRRVIRVLCRRTKNNPVLIGALPPVYMDHRARAENVNGCESRVVDDALERCSNELKM